MAGTIADKPQKQHPGNPYPVFSTRYYFRNLQTPMPVRYRLRMEDFLTAKEVAALLKISVDTVYKRFADARYVVNLGHEKKLHRRRYRILRIPMSAIRALEVTDAESTSDEKL
jgi:DNA invertase Pin-like site-specific DNA recombinase